MVRSLKSEEGQKLVRGALLVHIFRMRDLIKHLNHPHLFWDIDEIPKPIRDEVITGKVIFDSDKVELKKVFQNNFELCDLVLASSQLERGKEFIEPRKFKVIRNSVGDQFFAGKPRYIGNPKHILFVGNLNHSPNLEGLRFFIREVLPLILKEEPNLRLKISGRSILDKKSHQEFLSLIAPFPVDLDLNPENIRKSYDDTICSVVPILSGAGTRVKIIEAFALKCPVVSTTKGAEGLGVSNHKEILISDSPKGFANHCLNLFKQKDLSVSLADNAYAFGREHFSFTAIHRELKVLMVKRGLWVDSK